MPLNAKKLPDAMMNSSSSFGMCKAHATRPAWMARKIASKTTACAPTMLIATGTPSSIAASSDAEDNHIMPAACGPICTIDAVPTSAEIDRALIKLETLAKERGLAVGVASALPISIERIAAWIKTLDSRGIMLVPLTTAMLKSKSG